MEVRFFLVLLFLALFVGVPLFWITCHHTNGTWRDLWRVLRRPIRRSRS
jgi:ABC-type sulfate transport system permease component